MWRQVSVLAIAIFPLAALGPVWADEKKEMSPDAQKAVDAVRKFVNDKGAKGGGDITVKSEEVLKKVLPDYTIVNVRFRIYPIAKILPPGMGPSNLFAVKDGMVEHLKDVKAMQKFVREHQAPAKDEAGARRLLAAWLTLSQEFHQDGMFKFEVLDKEFAVEGKDEMNVKGRLTVMSGGNGEMRATVTVDKEGKLAKVEENPAIRPGPRPICQATKLLDAEPIVRRIAEQDLLIMGLAARDYLFEQREAANPDLRDAIDRIWQQIQKNGW